VIFQLLAHTGRRPVEICALNLDPPLSPRR
jgi:hypothetical protein